MTNIIPNIKDNDGFTIPGEAYETDIPLVLTKGCEIKPIGKTGYQSEKVPSVSSKAPTYYRLRDRQGITIDHFLSMACLKDYMSRHGLNTPVKTKKETLKEAYDRGYAQAVADIDKEYVKVRRIYES